jgi:hypothetical protein
MTCPYCYCQTCNAERAKWNAPAIPYAIPVHSQPFHPNSYYCNNCGMLVKGLLNHSCPVAGSGAS